MIRNVILRTSLPSALFTALLTVCSAGALLVQPALAQGVSFTQGTDQIAVSLDGKPFTAFFYGPEATKPYLHPLKVPSGQVISRVWPMEEPPAGEAKDHPHHRGLWFTHGVVNDLDFWANEKSQKGAAAKGRGNVVLQGAPKAKGGKKKGELSATFLWQDLQGATQLEEQRKMTFHAIDKNRPNEVAIDFHITLRAVQPVTFGDTKEGTFALRLRRELTEPRTGKMKSAEGKEGEKAVWGKRSPWVDYSGKLGDAVVGATIFDHPSNPRHPTYWHSRSYGLFAANIFGVHDFENDKSKNGELKLAAGEKLTFRYRVLLHDGPVDGAARFAEFSKTK